MEVENLRAYVSAKKTLEDLDAETKKVKAEKDRLEQLLLSEFEESGMQNAKVDDRLVYLNKQTWARRNPEVDDQALVGALESHGLGDLVKAPTVNPQTLSSYVREQLENGEEIPEDIASAIVISEVFSVKVRKS